MQFNKIFHFIFRSVHSHERCLLASSCLSIHLSTCTSRVTEGGFGPPNMGGLVKIFTLIWREQLSVAEWFGLGMKGLICKIDKLWYDWERQKHMQHSAAPCPLPYHCTPVICNEFPSNPTLVGTVFQHGSHCTDFHEIWYGGPSQKSVEKKIQMWLKSDKSTEQFT
jgi:hypothetical protein